MRLVELLGKGDFGTVFLATNPRGADRPATLGATNSADPSDLENQRLVSSIDDRPSAGPMEETVALKVVSKAEVLRRKNKLKRMQSEYEVLRLQHREQHPCLPEVHWVTSTQNYLLVAMSPYVGALHRIVLSKLSSRKFPNEATTRFVAAELLLALEFLHNHGIVHRDVKPENVLVRKDGHIVLGDFDLCRCDTSSAEGPRSPDNLPPRSLSPTQSQSTRRHSFVGTPEYMSPELVSDEPQTSALDLWALGILIYECTFGTTPFKGNTDRDTINKISRFGASPVPFPAFITTTPELKDLLSKLLVQNPKARLTAAQVKSHPWFKVTDFSRIPSDPSPLLEYMDPSDSVDSSGKDSSQRRLSAEHLQLQESLLQDLRDAKTRENSTDGSTERVWGDDFFAFFVPLSQKVTRFRESSALRRAVEAGGLTSETQNEPSTVRRLLTCWARPLRLLGE